MTKTTTEKELKKKLDEFEERLSELEAFRGRVVSYFSDKRKSNLEFREKMGWLTKDEEGINNESTNN